MGNEGTRSNGFVLVSVIWAVVFIASITAVFVNATTMHFRSNAAFIRAAQAEAAADGAIRLIGYRLSVEPPNLPDRTSTARKGSWLNCALFAGVDARISIQDQDGVVDLNHAPMPLIATLLRAHLAPSIARAAGEAIAAIRERFAQAPADTGRIGAGSGAFSTPDELLSVVADEADADKMNELLALLTVYTRSDGLDPFVAPKRLLIALAGPNVAPLEPQNFPAEYMRPSRSRFFAITADVGERSRGRSVRRAVVEVVRQPTHPFVVLEWTTVNASELPPDEEDTRPPTEPCSRVPID